MKIEELLKLSVKLNKAIKGTGLEIKINEVLIDKKEDIQKLAEQEGAYFHEPEPSLPYYWSSVKLGNIVFQIETKPVEFEIKIKE